MSKSLKSILFAIVGLIGLLILISVALFFLLTPVSTNPGWKGPPPKPWEWKSTLAADWESLSFRACISGLMMCTSGIGGWRSLLRRKPALRSLSSLCSTRKSGSGRSGCSAPGSPLSGTATACSISKNGRRPKGHSLPWSSIIFPSPTGLSSMGTNNPGKDSRWETSTWTCAACGLQEGIARSF